MMTPLGKIVRNILWLTVLSVFVNILWICVSSG